jgi:hypothetical protein
MSSLSANFTQSPEEVRRYLLDYTLFLSTGESVVSITFTITLLTPLSTPSLVVNNIVVGPGGLQALYFVSGGANGDTYEVTFLATTSIGQILQDVVQYNIVERT